MARDDHVQRGPGERKLHPFKHLDPVSQAARHSGPSPSCERGHPSVLPPELTLHVASRLSSRHPSRVLASLF